MLATPTAILLHLKTISGLSFVLCRTVIPPLTLGARQNNDVAH